MFEIELLLIYTKIIKEIEDSYKLSTKRNCLSGNGEEDAGKVG